MRKQRRWLRDAESVACAGHVAPDGDALGSALGLAAAARLAGKNVSVAFGDPSVLADNLNFLPLDLISPVAEFPSEPEVMVAFDTASAERLGSLEAPARKAKTLIVVDHHVSNEGFGDIQIIDATAAASAELAYLLISAAGWPIDDAAATSLYTGLVTDTGRFQYSATSPRTLRIAAHLIEAGVRPEVIGQNLYEKVPFGYLALSARVLGRSQLDKARSMVWSSMTKEDLRATGLRLRGRRSADRRSAARSGGRRCAVDQASSGRIQVQYALAWGHRRRRHRRRPWRRRPPQCLRLHPLRACRSRNASRLGAD